MLFKHRLLTTLLSTVFVLAPTAASATQTITDAFGQSITVPSPQAIHAIGDAWPAHLEVLAMLGAGDKVTSYVNIDAPENRPWLARVNPQMKNAAPAFTKTDVNLEEMLKQRPDVVFSLRSPRIRTQLSDLGIPNVQLIFSNFEELQQSFNLTAKVLGPKAQKRAADYNRYLTEKLAQVRNITSALPAAQKPRVLHVVNLHPLMVDGGHSIIDAWINAAGGINVAHAVHGAMKVTSREQLLAWNPDIVIFGATALPADNRQDQLKALEQDPMWSQLKAVKNHHLVVNPDGAFLWDRYGAETALQIQWAAKLLHPEQFKNLDMIAETKRFYRRFLDYDLTNTEAKEILAGLPPKSLE